MELLNFTSKDGFVTGTSLTPLSLDGRLRRMPFSESGSQRGGELRHPCLELGSLKNIVGLSAGTLNPSPSSLPAVYLLIRGARGVPINDG